MQFYKVKNLPVTEVLETIRSIEHQTLTSNFNPIGRVRRLNSDGRVRPAGFNDIVSGPNQPSVPGPTKSPASTFLSTAGNDTTGAADRRQSRVRCPGRARGEPKR